MTFGSQSPFGGSSPSPFGGNEPQRPAQHTEFSGVGKNDYRYGGFESPEGPANRRLEVSIFRAPWALLGAALTAMITSVFLAYVVTGRWLTEPGFENIEFLLLAVGVILPVSAAILALRTYVAGRLLLIVWAVLSLVLLLHETLWPVPIIAALGAVLAWLPAARRWTDY